MHTMTSFRAFSLSVALISGLVSMSGTTKAGVIPEVEPNNSIAGAQSLDGAFTTGYQYGVENSALNWPWASVQGGGDYSYDWYSFTVVSPGVQVIIDIDFTQYLDSWLELHSADGTTLAISDDYGYDPGSQYLQSTYYYYDSRIYWTFNVQNPGTYYVKVARYYNSTIYPGQYYTLNVTLSTFNTAPVAVCSGYASDDTPPPGPVQALTVECDNPAGRLVTLDGSASYDDDAGDWIASYQWDAPGVTLLNGSSMIASGMFPDGTTTAILTVTDSHGDVSTCDVSVTVEDTTPPTVRCATDVTMLWPPNHSMRSVQVAILVDDACTSPALVVPTSVTVRSNEPDNGNGLGDGNTTGDVAGGDGYTVPVDITSAFVFDASYGGNGAWVGSISLQAERDGTGQGRVYTIDAVATDGTNVSSPSSTSSCAIVVPKSKKNF